MNPTRLALRSSVLLLAGLVLALLLLLGWFFVRPSPVPVAFLRVVDERGQPVEGATITPDGLRPKKGGAHYSWHDAYPRSGMKPVPIRTDHNGYATVAYPFYAEERLETGQISFAVDHPDFCAQRPFRTVAPSPPANAALAERLKYVAMRALGRISSRPDAVVLKRGGIVKLRGYVGAKSNVVSGLQAEISNQWPAGLNFWQRDDGVLWSRKVVAGQNFLRAVSCLDQGRMLFSDDVLFAARAGETNEFELELRPGVKVVGRLDDSVPRPARNGRVCIRVFMKDQAGNNQAPVWVGWRPISADGTFVFESLPRGRLEVVGLCDGFVSRNGPPPSKTATSQRLPQLFALDGEEREVVLRMEPTAQCEVRVLDEAGRPLAGAVAVFSPNVLWAGNGSTVFADSLFNSEDMLCNAHQPDREMVRERTNNDFRARSDDRGVALVELPAGSQSYSVSHTNYEMPIQRAFGSPQRSGSVQLSAGETTRVVVKMQKKGTEALTH